MYIIKNAFRSIGRSKGRSILIGIIALVIAISACLGLSIRQAAVSAKESALEGISIKATISYDRAGQMGKIGGRSGSGQGGSGSMPGGFGGFDRSQFSDLMGNASSLTVDEYKKYAEAESVSDFYYTLTAYFNGSENFSPVSDEDDGSGSSESTDNSESGSSGSGESQSAPSGMPSIHGMSGMDFSGLVSTGDFTVVGYSSDTAMTSFADGTTSILEGGAMFEEGTTELECVISEELAIYNGLSVGDTITLTNPNLETETYVLKITGIYKSSQTNDFSMSFLGKSQDPANKIYMSANALQAILDQSEASSVTTTSETTGREKESKITGTVSATYLFATAEDYEKFESQARALGLDESYTISSSDLTSFESSLAPLDTLSTMAKWFLVVILVIGAVILVVLNIFNIRERKYEVGVLTAMGMKKWKVAAQFVCEILAITMVAVILGAAIGGVSSVPVTNALLENQIESQQTQKTEIDSSFGRSANFGGMPGMPGGMSGMPGGASGMPSGMSFPGQSGSQEFNNPFEKALSGAANYVSEVDSAMNLTVVLQMIGIGLLLTLVASAVSVMFIMRYDPLKILSNRD